jgi:ribonuclease-3
LNLDDPKSPLLLVALTHPSYTFENPNINKENNQRLEFLGDAVLDFIIGEYLYLKYSDKSEGELTKIRAAVVNESTLAQAARNIRLGQVLLLGRGEQVSGGRERSSILADALEAVIGAVYLQDGFNVARQFVLDMLVPIIDQVDQDHYGDYKTLLQEVAQRDDCVVCYRILDELGPDHDKSFTAGVFVRGVLKGKGTGKTKKEAEQLAARLTLENWEAK